MILPALTLLAVTGAPMALPLQEELVIGADSTLKFSFDWNGLDVDGNPTIATKASFRFFQLDVNPPPEFGLGRTVEITAEVAGNYKVPVSSVLRQEGIRDIPAGRWEVKARLLDEGGNQGPYSQPITVRVKTGRPSAPTNLGVVE